MTSIPLPHPSVPCPGYRQNRLPRLKHQGQCCPGICARPHWPPLPSMSGLAALAVDGLRCYAAPTAVGQHCPSSPPPLSKYSSPGVPIVSAVRCQVTLALTLRCAPPANQGSRPLPSRRSWALRTTAAGSPPHTNCGPGFGSPGLENLPRTLHALL